MQPRHLWPSQAQALEELVSVYEAVERDLTGIASRCPGLESSALAALALALAAEIDNIDNSATSKSMCAARLVEALDRLRELAPETNEGDQLDEITERRLARRAAASAP